MSQFLGTHPARLDPKGRISVPAPFRAALRNAAGSTLVLRPSHDYACVDAWPSDAFDLMVKPLESLDVFSMRQDDLQLALYGDAHRVEPDKDGRIILPESFIEHAGLNDTASFIGMGRMFQIWEPGAGKQRIAEARERTRAAAANPPRVSA